MKQLFSSDAVMGIKEFFDYDPVTDKAQLSVEQDVGKLVRVNNDVYNEYTSLDRWGDGQRVAQIPITIYNKLRKEGIVDDPAAFRRWLNDPENKVFRTRPGKV